MSLSRISSGQSFSLCHVWGISSSIIDMVAGPGAMGGIPAGSRSSPAFYRGATIANMGQFGQRGTARVRGRGLADIIGDARLAPIRW